MGMVRTVFGVWLVAIGLVFQWAAELLAGVGRVLELVGNNLGEQDLMP